MSLKRRAKDREEAVEEEVEEDIQKLLQLQDRGVQVVIHGVKRKSNLTQVHGMLNQNR